MLVSGSNFLNRKYIYISKCWIFQPAYVPLLEDQLELRECFWPLDIAGVSYPFLGGSNKNQIYGDFEGFPYCIAWVDNVMTPEIMFPFNERPTCRPVYIAYKNMH